MFLSCPEGMTKEQLNDALVFAVDHADHQSVHWLVNAGANPNVRIDSGWSLLHKACASGWSKVAKALIAAGADTHALRCGEWTPLHDAWTSGKSELARELMEAGHFNAGWKNSKGEGFLHWAVSKAYTAALDAFIAAGFPIDARSESGQTPLMLGAELGRYECVDLLIKNDAQIDLKADDGRTALHFSVRPGSEPALRRKIMRTLLAASANVDAEDNQGKTPLHWTCSLNDDKSTFIFLTAGAKFHLDREHQSALKCLLLASENSSSPPESCSEIFYKRHCLLMIAFGADTTEFKDIHPELLNFQPLQAAALLGLTARARALAQGGEPVCPNLGEKSLAAVAMEAGHSETASVLQSEEARQVIETIMGAAHGTVRAP